jgi:hypothetical protein
LLWPDGLLPFGRRRNWKIRLAAFCFIAVGLCGTGCGSVNGSVSGSGNTADRKTGAPVGSFTLTVSASSGGVASAKTVTLRVQLVK